MIFASLLASILLATATLSTPKGQTSHSRRAKPLQRLHSNNVSLATGASQAQYSLNWAGATLNGPAGTYTKVVGTFTVPTISGPDGGAAAWVGIDGATCQTALFQTGISFIIQGGQVWYNAWYEWLPDAPFFFYGLDINAGDAIRLTISTDTTTSGTVLIENLTNGQTLSQPVTSPYALCGQDADWIVEDYESFGTLVPFANFGTVTFTDTTASGGSGSVSPTGAMVVDIQQNGNTLTSTSVDSNGVNVQYV